MKILRIWTPTESHETNHNSPPNLELDLFVKLKCIRALIHTRCTYAWTRSKNAKVVEMRAKIKLVKTNEQSNKQSLV
jgi:hypothetical protein